MKKSLAFGLYVVLTILAVSNAFRLVDSVVEWYIPVCETGNVLHLWYIEGDVVNDYQVWYEGRHGIPVVPELQVPVTLLFLALWSGLTPLVVLCYSERAMALLDRARGVPV